MTEGTERYPGVELIEAAERLGATLDVDASWDAFRGLGGRGRLATARRTRRFSPSSSSDPTFPEADVARLRDERLNDLLQVKADPRRRVDQAFTSTIYAAGSPYGRPAGRRRDHGSRPDAGRLAASRTGPSMDPTRTALIVGGDLKTADVLRALGALGGAGLRLPPRSPADPAVTAPPVATRPSTDPIVRFYHRPGSVQTELRIGHVGLPRRTPDFHAVQVMRRDPRRPVQLAPPDEPARGARATRTASDAGFDMRRGRRARSRVRTAVQTRGDRAGHHRSARRAAPHSRDAGHPGGASRRARLPGRRLPAPVRDPGRRRRRSRRPLRPRPAGRRTDALPGGRRCGHNRRRPEGRPGTISTRPARDRGRGRLSTPWAPISRRPGSASWRWSARNSPQERRRTARRSR